MDGVTGPTTAQSTNLQKVIADTKDLTKTTDTANNSTASPGDDSEQVPPTTVWQPKIGEEMVLVFVCSCTVPGLNPESLWIPLIRMYKGLCIEC